LKTEGDLFQELRDFDRSIKAYKTLQTFCEIWQLKEPLINTTEQIGLCYRLMRIHGVAADCYKKQLQHAWETGDKKQELRCYSQLACEYYYLNDPEKMKAFD
jgi:hypothetical protein